MRRGVTASSQSYSACSPPRTPSTVHRHRCAVNPRVSRDHPLFSSNLGHISSRLQNFPRINLVRCKSNGDAGENESRRILDAFFLGKALAETLNERIQSAVGEFLSTIGRLQAEQQKQVQEFQDEVLEKARQAKEQAAREAVGAQGLIPKSTTTEVSAVNGVASNAASPQASSSEPKRTIDYPPSED
ncbi:hypothetical protein CDL12_19097 [Handroanthus impetiginosus]|uniref:Uncharacterized protein n=1 Tax=Handroanthus impetiginosus TaxID=429701 RepID=A0A2G9GSR8_9LAMI|nr:hypothetical protein CDL12_19097 [Handroanthus impetiginosus]